MNSPDNHLRPIAPPKQPPALIDTAETLCEVPTAARILRVPVPVLNGLADAGKVKVHTYLGRRMLCLEAVEAELAKGVDP